VTPAIRLLFVGLAALGVGVVGYWLYDRSRTHEPVAPVAIAPAASPAEAASGEAGPQPGELPGPKIPTTRPTFTLKDVDGKPRSITDWDGKAIVVNFWATWCAPCRREIPLLNALHAEYAPKGVEVVGVAVDFADDVKKYMEKMPIRYAVLVGEEDGLAAAGEFGVKSMAFPFSAFVDGRGRVLTVWMGEIHEPEARAILGVLLRMNAGDLEPEQARATLQTALEALPRASAKKDASDSNGTADTRNASAAG
jgi:thiol-disulfide isomerase/thioredoxin